MADTGSHAPAADVEALRARLAAWAADDAAQAAAGARARERHLHDAATEDATFGGLLLDHAERGDVVLLDLTGGHRRLGRLVAVGPDVAVVAPGAGAGGTAAVVLVATRHIVALSVEGAVGAVGDRPPPLSTDLRLLLAGVAGDRPRVHVVTAAADASVGTLQGVGQDVLTVHLDGTPRRTVHVPLAAIVEVVVVDL